MEQEKRRKTRMMERISKCCNWCWAWKGCDNPCFCISPSSQKISYFNSAMILVNLMMYWGGVSVTATYDQLLLHCVMQFLMRSSVWNYLIVEIALSYVLLLLIDNQSRDYTIQVLTPWWVIDTYTTIFS